MAKNLMICTNSDKKLTKLNEAEGFKKRYVLEGVFAELDVLNRNQRIYPRDEYLKHLQYLRDDIKKGEPLLGELDHPEDRFEVKMKEASHRIIDLWYDSRKNCVMGRIELLNTPNGITLQNLVDQGVPLHISSRAAGSVNSDNTVSIQQIYTYDVVAKPGFAGAVLHTVNESVSQRYTKDVMDFLTASMARESLNKASSYGFLNESMSISEIAAPVNLRRDARALQINNSEIETNEQDMIRALMNEADYGSAFKPAEQLSKPLGVNEGDDKSDEIENKSKDVSDDGGDDSAQSADEIEILDVKPVYTGDDESEDNDSEEDSEEDAEEDADKEGDGGSEADIDNAFGDDETNECDGAKSSGNEGEATPDKKLFDEEKKKIEDHKSVLAALKKISDDISKTEVKKKESNECAGACAKNEAILSQYPVTGMLNESNFAEFASLDEHQKNNVVAYLQESKMFDPVSVNQNWKNGVDYKVGEPVWLSHAPAEYRHVYESCSDEVKNNVKTQASYLIFENQNDINMFWERCGIMRNLERKLINESFVSKMPKIVKNEPQTLPYGSELVEQIASMALEYNRK